MRWLIAVVVVAVIGGVLFYWMRRRRRHRLISFVGLLKNPATFDPAVVASVAGKAWNADLGDGSSEGADGFVVGVGMCTTVMYDRRMFLINNFTQPYVEDAEQAAANIPDLRIRSLFSQHEAWFSCDALGVDGSTSEEEVREWYRRLGRLFAAFLDDNCLLLFLPDSGLAFPINENTEAALRSSDPLDALQKTLTLPIIEVSADDPLMMEAVAKAREEWPKFLAAYEAKAAEHFAVKAPVTHGGNTEFIWLTVTAVEGDRIYGELDNDPGNLGSLRHGSKVSVAIADLNDWCYADDQGNMVGGFTIAAVQKAAQRRAKE